MKKILFWLGVCGVSLLVMVQPVQASGTVSAGVESVAPVAGTENPFFYPSINSVIHRSTPELTCSALAAAYGGAPTYNYDHIADSGAYGAVRKYSCWLKLNSSGVVSNVTTIYPDNANLPSCPAASPSYSYSSLINSCVRNSCPANSTGTTTCTCTDPYIPNAGATACVMPACPAANSSAGSYWINSGTVPDSLYKAGLGVQCLNGCQTEGFSAVVTVGGGGNAEVATKIVAGVKQYFAKRYFYYSGQTCTGNSQPASGEVPGQQTCAAGQSYIQMGAQFKCINPVTGQTVDTNSVSAVAAAQTLADAKIAAQIAAAGAAAAAAGGSASDVAAAQSVAAGAAAVAAGAPTDNGLAPDDPLNAFCVDNPQASICKEQTAGNKAVGTAALDGLYTDGALIGGKTVSSVVGGFKTSVLASGIGSAAGGFFTVNQAAGTCPVWSADVPMFGVMTFDFYCQSTFQNLLPWIRAVFLLIFSVVAFRIAIL